MILALFLMATLGRTEEALRASLLSVGAMLVERRVPFPYVVDETIQPDADYVLAMADDVRDAELRDEMSKAHAPVSLRMILKGWRKSTTAKEIESVIRDGTPQERLDRFKQRYPNGLLRLSAVGRKPHSTNAFVTYQLVKAHLDDRGELQLFPTEIGLVELVPDWQSGWAVYEMHPVELSE